MRIASGLGNSSPFIYRGRYVSSNSSSNVSSDGFIDAASWLGCICSGLYQIHLVKADAIRPFIPKQLTLDQTLGYTLGGFYLGNYQDSSFGAFDELVVIAGTVKSGQSSSCAWSAKVLISSDDVRDYAEKELGVVTHAANFSKKIKEMDRRGFLNISGFGRPKNYKHIQITQMNEQGEGAMRHHISINTASATADEIHLNRLITTPQIKLSFPCFSGLSKHIPDQLLEYICHLETRVRVVGPAKVSDKFASSSESDQNSESSDIMARIVLQSKPFVAFEFSSMKMMVGPPIIVLQR